MNKTDEIKTAGLDDETIIRQHRRYTHWLEGRKTIGEGSLVLTNHRLLFLHRIESTPEVTASIKKLADAPIKAVLDHALTLHRNCFQIQLSSIVQVGIGIFAGFPLPHFYLWINYLKGKNQILHLASFQFGNPQPGIFFQPQVFVDLGWKNSIQQAMREAV